jgi:membrane protein
VTAGRLPRFLEFRPIAAVMDFARDWITRFIGIQGIDRSMAIGAQAYTALFPLLIVYASVLPYDADFADAIIQRFELTGAAAASVESAFAPSGEVQSSVTAIGVLLLLVSALSFSRGMQRLYETAFGLPTLGMKNTKWGLLWLALICLIAAVRPVALGGLGGTAELVASLAVAGVIWLATPYLLLGRRARAGRLAPVAVLSTIGMTGVGIWSAIWMPVAVASSSREFGVIGVGFALLTWLVAIGSVLVVAATGGAVIAERLERRRPAA